VRFPKLVEGRLVRREKRFFAHVELADGRRVVSHCANPGSMKGCARERARVWLSESDSPARQLRFTWELVEGEAGGLVCVNTARANQLVAEALTRGAVAELRGWGRTRREVRYGSRSRVDFLLQRGRRLCYLEVKSVTLDLGGRVAGFPDSVTERGRRHLEELAAMAADGHRAVLLFAVNRSGARAVRPADHIDPRYGEALRSAAGSGVELLAYASRLTTAGMTLARPVPVQL
jgi:sugar fermentation stimulation protein A